MIYDLAAWLLEQITVDEDAAYWTHFHDCEALGEVPFRCTCGVPKRLEAECAAKRGIVGEHAIYDGWYCSACGDVPQVRFPCPTLRLLALPYADREGYLDEWRPSGVSA